MHQPITAKPGQPKPYDYEYKRNGPANLFVFLNRTSALVKGQSQHQPNRFAARMRDLTDVHFPKAERILDVLDSRHISVGAVYEAFPAYEARRILFRLEHHYVPKHASWLNSVFKVSARRFGCATRALLRRHDYLHRVGYMFLLRQ
jgi:hypothetical protein